MKINAPVPLVTVIVPAYNAQNYLINCINSLLNQTYKNLEIIIVNDGSTDQTIDICNNYRKVNTNITLLTQSNGGVSSARNLGIKNAAGDYITFVDSDDELLPNAIADAYCAAKKFSSDIVGYNSIIIDYNDTKTNLINNRDDITLTSNDEIILSFLTDNIIGESACNKLFARSAIDNIYFDEEIRINEDKLYLFRVIINCQRYTYINISNYKINKRRDSASNSVYNKNFYGIKKVADIVFAEISISYPEFKHFAELEKIKAYIQLFKNMSTSMIGVRGNQNYSRLKSQIRIFRYRKLGNYVYTTQFFIIKYCPIMYIPITKLYKKSLRR